MITHYHRPNTINQAIRFLSKPGFQPMGGGTFLNQPSDEVISIVDLQALGLDSLDKVGNSIEIGATVNLQAILESSHSPLELKNAIRLEIPLNLRNMATIGGSIVACNGRSPLLTALLTLDPIVTIVPDIEQIPLGDLLPFRREILRGKLITKINFSLTQKLAFEYVARAPMDKPIICLAIARWPSGRARMVLGGWDTIPTLAMDGKLSPAKGDLILPEVAQNAAMGSTDGWASEEYRRSIAMVLAGRCWERVNK